MSLPIPLIGRKDDKYVVLIIKGGSYDRIELDKHQESYAQDGVDYQLKRHKQFVHNARDWLLRRQRTFLWIFNKDNPVPVGIGSMSEKQDYKKVSPATLKVIVTQNITRSYFKSLVMGKAFGGIGKRKMIMLFVGVAVIVIALKMTGVF